jgi:inorganic pyrophosphatase
MHPGRSVSPDKFPPFADGGAVNVVIETPRGSRNKFKYNPELGAYQLAFVMPEGSEFPYEFGFVPGTEGADGDPVDVLVLLDAPTAMGCLVTARLIGAIEAEQTENGKTERNDRLIAVATHSRHHRDMKSLGDLPAAVLDDLEQFFVSYNRLNGKEFRPVGRAAPEKAAQLLKKSLHRSRR